MAFFQTSIDSGRLRANMPSEFRKRPNITLLAGYLFANIEDRFSCGAALLILCITFEPRHEIINMRSLIRAFASHLNIL